MRAWLPTVVLCLACGVSHPTPPAPLQGLGAITLPDGRVVRIGSKAPLPADTVQEGTLYLWFAHDSYHPQIATYTLSGSPGPVRLDAELFRDKSVAAFKVTFAPEASLSEAIAWYTAQVGPPDTTTRSGAQWRRGKWTLNVHAPYSRVQAGADDIYGPAVVAWLDHPHKSGLNQPYQGQDFLGWEQCLAVGSRDCHLVH